MSRRRIPIPPSQDNAKRAKPMVFDDARSVGTMPPGVPLKQLCRGFYDFCKSAFRRMVPKDRLKLSAALDGGHLNILRKRHRDLLSLDAVLAMGFYSPRRKVLSDSILADVTVDSGTHILSIGDIGLAEDYITLDATLNEGDYIPTVEEADPVEDFAVLDATLEEGDYVETAISTEEPVEDFAVLDAALTDSGEYIQGITPATTPEVSEYLSLTASLDSGIYDVA